MPTKRTRTQRDGAQPPSDRAIALFSAIEQAERRRKSLQCVARPATMAIAGYCNRECAACRKVDELNAALHVELGWKIWERWPPLPSNPYPPWDARYRTSDDDEDTQAVRQWLDDWRRYREYHRSIRPLTPA